MNRRHVITRVVAFLFALLLLMPPLSIVVANGDCDTALDTDVSSEGTVVEPTVETVIEEETEPTIVETEPPLIEEPLLYKHIEYIEFGSVNDAQEFMNELSRLIELLHNEVGSAMYTEQANELMLDEVSRLNKIKALVETHIDDLCKWEARYEQYPYATRLWKFLKEHGYSDVVCAGILGNFMTETGGHTLSLRPHIYDSTGIYYGMAQWSGKYHAEVRGVVFEDQCEYLVKTMRKEFDTFGFKYRKGFDYEDFLNLTSPEEAALAFAKCYERCHPISHNIRQTGAVTAYKYFT